MTKALIVDDHESMCDSLTYALKKAGGFKVIGKLQSAANAEVYCERLRPDLVLNP